MRHRHLAVAGLVLLARPALAEEAWHEATSPNFVLVTNASEARALSIIETAERFRDTLTRVLPHLRLFTPGPTLLFGFRDFDSFEPFLPATEEGESRVAGYFRGGGARNVIVVDLSPGVAESTRILFHEYAHLVLSLEERRFPLWFEEGFAEFYAGTRLGDAYADVGLSSRRHRSALSGSGLVPLEDLLRAADAGEWHREGRNEALFYAQSWALVHFLLTSAPEGQERLARFLARSTGEGDPVALFREAFGEEAHSMEEALGRYVKAGSFPTFKVPLFSKPSRAGPTSRRLTRAEVLHRRGELFLATGHLPQARVCLEEAVGLDASLAGPLETLGFLSLSEGERGRARGFFHRASALDGATASGLHQYAGILLADYSGAFIGSIPDDVADEAASVLRRSLSLEPGAREPAELLAFVYIVRGERLDEAEALIETALAASGRRASLLYLRGQLLARRGQYDEAREVLTAVALESTEPGLSEAVLRFLSRLSEVEKAPGR